MTARVFGDRRLGRDRRRGALPSSGAGWEPWARFARHLVVPEGVHRPSPFSAVLASTVPMISGRSVVDAGCGAGLLTIAALARGAVSVTALDVDASALHATSVNVARMLGADAVSRLRLQQGDFRDLGRIPTDLLLVNPPQRPTIVRAAAGAVGARDAGGADGLEAVRDVLESAEARELWTTAARVLPVDRLSSSRWSGRRLVAHATVPMDPVWKAAGASAIDEVDVWGFTRLP